ncbi:hypothetical protein TSOC_011589 [Tetrabaena socialis]|uniref:Uncharacterized protein n=1 Tax=Tetrabaena socialis TaxID=47790 RepID=A0A2J7ZQA2_9CHLO|nr:hypothetical protein TSOC_011589 [Tetrabaena socialis]|eukprot:PNH02445.1 hypothetical protein TSOC_011589 [Tetrabaena socialis]
MKSITVPSGGLRRSLGRPTAAAPRLEVPARQPPTRRGSYSHNAYPPSSWESDSDEDDEDAEDAEDLMFCVDDLSGTARDSIASPRAAFSRAVCVSHHEQPAAKGAPLTALELKVMQLVADSLDVPSLAAAPATAPAAISLPQLAQRLRRHGLRAAVVAASARPQTHTPAAPLSPPAAGPGTPFLVVAAAATPAAASGSDLDASFIIVDPSLRDHLSVAPASPAFRRQAARLLPAVFVGTPARLAQLVGRAAAAIAANFGAQGMEVPPWRRPHALLARWAQLPDSVLHGLRHDAGSGGDGGAVPGGPAAAEAAEAEAGVAVPRGGAGSLAAARRGDSYGTTPRLYGGKGGVEVLDVDVFGRDQGWARGGAAAAAAPPVAPIVGFEVGSAAVGREPWLGVKPGAFASAVRGAAARPRSDDTSGDGGSEEVLWGLSPVCVCFPGA